jgi:hypothetical protein
MSDSVRMGCTASGAVSAASMHTVASVQARIATTADYSNYCNASCVYAHTLASHYYRMPAVHTL